MLRRTVAICMLQCALASAQVPEPSAEPADPATTESVAAYQRGLELARGEQWGEAIVQFERAARLKDSAVIRFNIGYCQRALGNYVGAWRTFRTVSPKDLPTGHDATLAGYLRELEETLVRVDVRLVPAAAELSVDGRPLEWDAGQRAFLTGVAPAGESKSARVERFVLILNPGSHVVRASRPGHTAALVRRSYKPGQRDRLELELELLPARVFVGSTPRGAIVHVDGREVGVSPLSFERPSGRYALELQRNGFDPYRGELRLEPGEEASMTAKLIRKREALTSKWWFWTAAAGVVVAGAAVTYALTRPEPEPPPYRGGNTGWVVPKSF